MIFLSASVPTPGREYYGTEDTFAIREATIAFTRVCVEYNIPFFFGGHPSITPLIWSVAMQHVSNGLPLISIYQSKIFGEEVPKEVKGFKNVHFTEPVENDKRKSVEAMREQMFNENPVDCAVYIGGMNGVVDEYKLIKQKYQYAEHYAFASTGGASVDIYNEVGNINDMLESDYAYTSVFRKILKKYKR